jgi:sterol carrier protein 2
MVQTAATNALTQIELGYDAGIKAMLDAGITYDDVEHGVACYCYGDTCSGQRIFYQFGMNSIPIYVS